jgi:signal peptidase II
MLKSLDKVIWMKKYYLIAILILVCDHLSKWIAAAKLDPNRPFDIIPGFFSFSLVRNTGVAFGIFSGAMNLWKPYALAGIALIALIAMYIYSIRVPLNRKLLHCALAITMGGIMGNCFDRLLHGHVIDFIDIHLRDSYYWPTFNIADSAITIGIALLLIDSVVNQGGEEAAGDAVKHAN